MAYAVRYKLVEYATAQPVPEPCVTERTAGPFASRDRAEEFACAIGPRAYWVRIAEDDADARDGRT